MVADGKEILPQKGIAVLCGDEAEEWCLWIGEDLRRMRQMRERMLLA